VALFSRHAAGVFRGDRGLSGRSHPRRRDFVQDSLSMSDVAEEGRRLAAHASAVPSPGRCWSCGLAIDAGDRYCRRCGQGQGAFLAWYYRPLWIVLLALTVLGPFALPLVWRTPSLDRRGKWLASVAVVTVCGYVAWEFVLAAREIGRLLGDM
jgi:hypothetical protein